MASVSRSVFTLSFCLALLTMSITAQAQSAQKPILRTAEELPPFSYPVRGSPGELISSPSGFADLSKAFGRHIQGVLSRYDIRDQATLSAIHQTLAQLEALDGHNDRALQESATAANFIAKIPEKRKYAITFAADLKALQLVRAGSDLQTDAYRSFLRQLFESATWSDAGEAALALKGFCTRFSPVYAEAVVDNDAGSAAAGGSLSYGVAAEIVNFRFVLNRLPLCGATADALGPWLNLHRKEEQNPFGEHNLTLTLSDGGQRIVIAVWDTGFDRALFNDRLALPATAPIHGTDWNGQSTTGDLQQLDASESARMPETLRLVRGLGDSFEGVDSPDTAFYFKTIHELKTVEEARDLDHRVWVVANYYTHGTAVADIALRGNPFARLLPLRLEPPDRATAPIPTVEGARRAADQFVSLVNYCRTNRARVVNMSWGIGIGDLEAQLGKQPNFSADQRHQFARRIFAIYRDGMQKAIRSAPEILFVAASGNSGADPEFDLGVPQCLWTMPNVLVIGALDRAARPSWISNFGPSVKLYALGERVECLLPGGTRALMTGTSMASPAVANLAGKLLALRPDLSPSQITELMIRGSVPSQDGGFPGLNPKKSRYLLNQVGRPQ